MVSVLHKELEHKAKKLKYKKLEVMQPMIKNKSELPASPSRGLKEMGGLLTFLPWKGKTY